MMAFCYGTVFFALVVTSVKGFVPAGGMKTFQELRSTTMVAPEAKVVAPQLEKTMMSANLDAALEARAAAKAEFAKRIAKLEAELAAVQAEALVAADLELENELFFGKKEEVVVKEEEEKVSLAKEEEIKGVENKYVFNAMAPYPPLVLQDGRQLVCYEKPIEHLPSAFVPPSLPTPEIFNAMAPFPPKVLLDGRRLVCDDLPKAHLPSALVPPPLETKTAAPVVEEKKKSEVAAVAPKIHPAYADRTANLKAFSHDRWGQEEFLRVAGFAPKPVVQQSVLPLLFAEPNRDLVTA